MHQLWFVWHSGFFYSSTVVVRVFSMTTDDNWKAASLYFSWDSGSWVMFCLFKRPCQEKKIVFRKHREMWYDESKRYSLFYMCGSKMSAWIELLLMLVLWKNRRSLWLFTEKSQQHPSLDLTCTTASNGLTWVTLRELPFSLTPPPTQQKSVNPSYIFVGKGRRAKRGVKRIESWMDVRWWWWKWRRKASEWVHPMYSSLPNANFLASSFSGELLFRCNMVTTGFMLLFF